jgi:hypothetical protein
MVIEGMRFHYENTFVGVRDIRPTGLGPVDFGQTICISRLVATPL